MRRFKLLTLIFILASAVSSAQEGLSTIDTYLDRLRRDNYFSIPNQLGYSDIEGTPYLIDLFRQGSLLMKSGLVLTGEFRFDIYANQIEFRKDERVFAIALPDSIAKLEIDDVVLVYMDYADKADTKKGYFILLEEGHHSVYQQKVKLFRSASPPKPYQDAPLPARFEEGSDLFYMSVGSNPATRISSANDIIKLCGDQGQSARDYIRSEKINIKRPADLAKLARYLNESMVE